MNGHFYVGELPDGRFVAASNQSPYFCFRGDTEEAVLQRVAKALSFFGEAQGVRKRVDIKSVSQTVTQLRPTRKVDFAELPAPIAA